ncbi:phosphoribosyl-ATP diphosphatase [Euzebya tangerina]|uniref:phosphoribosyl-ATP diphosphatase n=1 Tax=Euzebya tangerina TaxID=591198 RepID=UPI000E310E89|nr:phosphoribosyl-ATP diphosphatase [Euzebya tangerina]
MADLLTDLDALLQSRKREQPADSYSVSLITDPVVAQRKIMEEAFEVCLELGAAEVDQDRTASEAADLVFHLMAGLTGAGVRWEQVLAHLARRRR